MLAGGGIALRGAGAARRAAGLGASSCGPRFVEPMGEDCFGMRHGPAVGQQFLQPRIVRMQAQEKVADVAPWFDAMTLRTGQDRT